MVSKKLLAIVVSAFALSACSDAMVSSFGRFGDEQVIQCYSGGVMVFSDVSTGMVEQSKNGLYYKSKGTGKFIQVYMDCLVKDS